MVSGGGTLEVKVKALIVRDNRAGRIPAGDDRVRVTLTGADSERAHKVIILAVL